jgi:hypothetical protein
VVGTCRITVVAFDAVVRRVVRTASLARDEHRSRACVSAPHPALSAELVPDPGTPAPPHTVEEK